MRKFPMRSLLFSAVSLLLAGCASEYGHLEAAKPDAACASAIAPLGLETAWYDASVDVMGKHLSGLLLLKNMPDSSQRIVFTNEAGITFFDFGFSKGVFKVYSVISQLDKKPVIGTLRKDFALIIGLPFRNAPYTRYVAGDEVYFGVAEKSETAYFITSKDCASLQRLEWGTARKRKVSVHFPGSGYPSPDSITLQHYTFNLEIRLTRIPKQ